MTFQRTIFLAPKPTIETKQFWEGVDAGRFLLKNCNACEKTHYYPRTICPLCGSSDTEYLEASGRGTIYSFSTFEMVKAPYAIAYIQLEEGPIVMSNIVDCDLKTLKIGQSVTLCFAETEGDGPQIPVFTPQVEP
uniref:DNA-binding protein n=1 Tax=OCS116 cluster bacterium TaxID=2030921 RepID=A0A2A4YZY0_9PROT